MSRSGFFQPDNNLKHTVGLIRVCPVDKKIHRNTALADTIAINQLHREQKESKLKFDISVPKRLMSEIVSWNNIR